MSYYRTRRSVQLSRDTSRLCVRIRRGRLLVYVLVDNDERFLSLTFERMDEVLKCPQDRTVHLGGREWWGFARSAGEGKNRDTTQQPTGGHIFPY